MGGGGGGEEECKERVEANSLFNTLRFPVSVAPVFKASANVLPQNIARKLANRMSYQIGMFHLRRGVHIRCDSQTQFFCPVTRHLQIIAVRSRRLVEIQPC